MAGTTHNERVAAERDKRAQAWLAAAQRRGALDAHGRAKRRPQ